jgi:hypothetical protein
LRIHSLTLADVVSTVFGVKDSTEKKFVSDSVFFANDEFAAGFLSALFDCDGFVSHCKPEVEYTTLCKCIAERVSAMLLRFGVIPSFRPKRNKRYDKDYYHVYLTGSDNMRAFQEAVGFLHPRKRERLGVQAKRGSNTNVDVIPGLGPVFDRALSALGMTESEAGRRAGLSAGVFSRYAKGFDTASRRSVGKVACVLAARKEKLSGALRLLEGVNLPDSTPARLHSLAVESSHGLEYKRIAAGCGVSAATVGRMLSGRTGATDNLLDVCGGVVDACGPEAPQPLLQSRSAYLELCRQWPDERIFGLADEFALPYDALDEASGLHNGAWASFKRGERKAGVFNRVKMLAGLRARLSGMNARVQEAKDCFDLLESLASSDVFWDEVAHVEEMAYPEPYVYDLAMEGAHNFLAGAVPLVVHNSYLAGVLIEELLDRPKALGRPAIIVIDVHGEYRFLAERGSGYSDRVTVVDGRKMRIGMPSVTPGALCEFLPGASDVAKRELSRALERLHRERRDARAPYRLEDLIAQVEGSELKENVKGPLAGMLYGLKSLRLFGSATNPSLKELARPGRLSVIDLSGIDDMRRKQVIVAFFARKLFKWRKKEKIPPFLLMVEESHNFAREKARSAEFFAKPVIEMIAREGRKFGASLCLISQRPVQLSTTALSQANTHVIMRVTNPYDIDHIGKSCEGIDKGMLGAITTLRTGEAMVVGEAANFPVFLNVRRRKSSRQARAEGIDAIARRFEERSDSRKKDVEAFL